MDWLPIFVANQVPYASTQVPKISFKPQLTRCLLNRSGPGPVDARQHVIAISPNNSSTPKSLPPETTI